MTKIWTPDSKLVAKVIPAMHFGSREGVKPTIIVLHTAETSEITNSAEGTAGFFKGGSGGVKASTQYVVDIDGTIQSVRERDRAFGAVGFNANGIHIEQAGRAAQGPAQWADDYSKAMLDNQVIPLVADICRRRGIRPQFLSAASLLAGETNGITTHAECTLWAKRKKIKTRGHTDPGKDYPINRVMDAVRKLLG